MKFKVGDRVRLTREALYNKFSVPTEEEVFGGIITDIDKDGYHTVEGFEDDYLQQSLELVAEEPDFKYGEEIEISRDGKKWEKRIYLTTITLDKKNYICVSDGSVDRYESGLPYRICECPYARKHKPQLTRKEIAEKLGVDEDFIFVDN